jgi:hypothetical protein
MIKEGIIRLQANYYLLLMLFALLFTTQKALNRGKKGV